MRHIETQVQAAIVRWLRFNGFLCTSTGAGLIKAVKTQITRRKCGYLQGTPDIIVFIRGGSLGIECKKPKTMRYSAKSDRLVVDTAGGTQTASQKEFERNLTDIPGHFYMVATDPMDVVKFIREKGIQPR